MEKLSVSAASLILEELTRPTEDEPVSVIAHINMGDCCPEPTCKILIMRGTYSNLIRDFDKKECPNSEEFIPKLLNDHGTREGIVYILTEAVPYIKKPENSLVIMAYGSAVYDNFEDYVDVKYSKVSVFYKTPETIEELKSIIKEGISLWI